MDRLDSTTSVSTIAKEPHPFAAVLKTIGRGATLGRPLDLKEAEAAFDMILRNEVEPVQLGAFLLVLRYRKETASELAGFVHAARRAAGAAPALRADLDWPSYADHHKQLPYFLLAARLLSAAGVRILMHGIDGTGPVTTRAALSALGMPVAADAADAALDLDRHGFAYLPLERHCPALASLFDLRALLGLRSPVNSLARALNPAGAPAQIQGVFHPTYAPLHRDTALHLGVPRAMIFKGGGGEAQRNPDKPCRTILLEDGEVIELAWPALNQDDPYGWRKESLDPATLAALWTGELENKPPELAVIGTVALALRLLGRERTQEAAEHAARTLWQDRDRRLPGRRFGTGPLQP